jgi:hypothetical protein
MQKTTALHVSALVAAFLLTSGSVQAQVARFTLYDDFNPRASLIDPALWFESEQSRSIKRGALNLS